MCLVFPQTSPLCTSAGGSVAVHKGPAERRLQPGSWPGTRAAVPSRPPPPGWQAPRGRGGCLGSVGGPARRPPGWATGLRLVSSRRVWAGQVTRRGLHLLWRPGGLARFLHAAPRLPAQGGERAPRGRSRGRARAGPGGIRSGAWGPHQVGSGACSLSLRPGPRTWGPWSLSRGRARFARSEPGAEAGSASGRCQGPSRGPGPSPNLDPHLDLGPGSESQQVSRSALGSRVRIRVGTGSGSGSGVGLRAGVRVSVRAGAGVRGGGGGGTRPN